MRRWPAIFPVSAALFMACLLWPIETAALIKVDLPVSGIYRTARVVAIGDVASVDADKRLVVVRVAEVCKGAISGQEFRVQLAAPAQLAAEVRAGHPVVLFAGPVGGRTVLHMADTWLLGERVVDASAETWRAVGPFDGDRSFPGRTDTLAKIVRELKAGNRPIRDAVSHEAFSDGKARLLARAPGKPAYLLTGDFDGDTIPDALVGGQDGEARFMRITNRDCVDATVSVGLDKARAGRAAAGDVDGDGKPDLLLGRTIWIQQDGQFKPSVTLAGLADEADWLAAVVADVTGDGRGDVVVLLRSGRLRIAVNPGPEAKNWAIREKVLWTGLPRAQAAEFSTRWADTGRLHVMVVHDDGIRRYCADGGEPMPADFRRLTGIDMDRCDDFGRPVRVLFTAAFDYDGLGEPDFVVITQAGGLTLFNRGYGCFLINGFLHKTFHSSPEDPIRWTKPFPFRLHEIAAVAPGRILTGLPSRRLRQTLLVLTGDGALYELDNSR